MSRAEDGRIAYRMKRPLPDGTTHLLFTGLDLVGDDGNGLLYRVTFGGKAG